MWLKILRETVPHLVRLAPAAQKYLEGRGGQESAALAGLQESLKGDLGKVTSTNASLHRQLQDQTAVLVEVRDQVSGLEDLHVSLSARVESMENQLVSVTRWLKISALLSLGLLAAILVVLLRAH
jgi:hypothetical protein